MLNLPFNICKNNRLSRLYNECIFVRAFAGVENCAPHASL